MTLNDYKMLRYEDFFLAIIQREINWKEAEHIFLTIPEYPYKITALDLLKTAIDEALIENNELLTEENRKRIEEDVKQSISPNLEEWYPVILVKYGNGYLDLSQMQELESSYKIICQIPLIQYYKEEEYSFEEDKDGPYLNIDMQSFNVFTQDYKEGKFK